MTPLDAFTAYDTELVNSIIESEMHGTSFLGLVTTEALALQSTATHEWRFSVTVVGQERLYYWLDVIPEVPDSTWVGPIDDLIAGLTDPPTLAKGERGLGEGTVPALLTALETIRGIGYEVVAIDRDGLRVHDLDTPCDTREGFVEMQCGDDFWLLYADMDD